MRGRRKSKRISNSSKKSTSKSSSANSPTPTTSSGYRNKNLTVTEITSKSPEKDSQIPAKNFKKDLHRRFLKESRESIDDNLTSEIDLNVGNSNASASNMASVKESVDLEDIPIALTRPKRTKSPIVRFEATFYGSHHNCKTKELSVIIQENDQKKAKKALDTGSYQLSRKMKQGLKPNLPAKPKKRPTKLKPGLKPKFQIVPAKPTKRPKMICKISKKPEWKLKPMNTYSKAAQDFIMAELNSQNPEDGNKVDICADSGLPYGECHKGEKLEHDMEQILKSVPKDLNSTPDQVQDTTMENKSYVSLDMPIFDSPIAQVDGQDKSIRTRNNKNSSNQKTSKTRQNSKSADANEKTKLVNNPVNKGFRIPKKPVKETTVEEAQNIDVQIKNSENIMENLVKPEESTANDAQTLCEDESMETDEIKTCEKNDEELNESEHQENLEEGEVPDSDEEISIVKITDVAREPRRPLKRPPNLKRKNPTAFDLDLKKMRRRQEASASGSDSSENSSDDSSRSRSTSSSSRSSSSDTEKRVSRPTTSKKIRSEVLPSTTTTTRSSSTESTERLIIDEKNHSTSAPPPIGDDENTEQKESEQITTGKEDTEKQDESVINIQETGNNEMSDDHSDIAENNDENRALIPGEEPPNVAGNSKNVISYPWGNSHEFKMMQAEIENLMNQRLCLVTLEFGENICNNCDFNHAITAQNVLSFYKIIRDPNEHFVPNILKGREGTPKIDRLLGVYHSQKIRVNALMNRHVAIQFLNDLLEDMKRNLNPTSIQFQMALKRLSTDLNFWYKNAEDFKREFSSHANSNYIGDEELNDICVAVERFIELSHLIEANENAIKLAYTSFEFSLARGMPLQPGILDILWSVLLKADFCDTRNSWHVYLTYVSVYILERPDVNFNFMPKLWATIQLLIQHRKEREKSELLNILSPSILNLDIEQLSSNKAVLQSLVNFSCSAIQENKHFPNSSELMERFKFLRDQLPIVIPDGFITKAVDTALNLKLYDLLCEQKIGQIVDMFLKISLNNYAEMNKFMYNLALCIMEQRQDDVSISLSTFLDKFMTEKNTREGIRILPIHHLVLAQFVATLVFDIEGDLVSVKNLVIQCIKYHFQPWKCRTFFNPEAEDTLSIKKKREPHEILILTLKALVSSADFELDTANLMLRHKELIFHLLEKAVYDWTELYDITKTLLERLLQIINMESEKRIANMHILCNIFDNIFHQICLQFYDQTEIRAKNKELFNSTVICLLEFIPFMNDELVTIVLPFVTNFYQSIGLTGETARVLLHICVQKWTIIPVSFHSHVEKFYGIGIQEGEYVCQELDSNTIVVKNCHSHWEISYILKDSFQKLATFRDAEIRRWKELFEVTKNQNKRELSAITSIFSSLEIRIEYLTVSKNSRSRHLRGFDCSDLKQTATRIFQALRSLNPPIAAIQLPIENAQKGGKQLRMVIRETNNLLQHLYSEFLEEPVHTQ